MPHRLYIVTYDISSPKRWRRVYAHLHKLGEHRQLSVFLVKTDARGLDRLAARLEGLIDPKTDSILIAPVGRGEADRMVELGLPGPSPGAQLVIF